jgi:hypothetical protein
VPPLHFIPHILRGGGIPAAIGLVVAGVLAWPQSDVVTTAPFVTTYHNQLGGSGLELESAVGLMIGFCIIGALVGLAVGAALIALGVVEKKDLGIEE